MIRKTTGADIEALAMTLRDDDLREIAMLTDLDPLAALSVGYFHSTSCITGLVNGEIACVFGVAPTEAEGTATAWLLSSEAIHGAGREVLTEGRAWLDEQNRTYRRMFNFITESNRTHLKLAKALGFTLNPPVWTPGVPERIVPIERIK